MTTTKNAKADHLSDLTRELREILSSNHPGDKKTNVMETIKGMNNQKSAALLQTSLADFSYTEIPTLAQRLVNCQKKGRLQKTVSWFAPLHSVSNKPSALFLVSLLCQLPAEHPLTSVAKERLSYFLSAISLRSLEKILTQQQQQLTSEEILAIRSPWGLPLITSLKNMFATSSLEQKKALLTTLSRFTTEAPELLNLFLSSLGEAKAEVCKMAALAVTHYKEQAIAKLLIILEKAPPRQQALAAWSLGKIAIADEKVITALLQAINHPQERVRKPAAWALENMTASFHNQILSHFYQATPPAKIILVNLLVQQKPVSEETIHTLMLFLEEEPLEIQKAALQALAAGGKTAKIARDSLLHYLQSPDQQLQILATQTLANIGVENDPDVIQALTALLPHPNAELCQQVLKTLGQVASSDPQIASMIASYLSHPEPALQLTAMQVLQQVQVEDKNVIFSLLAFMENSPQQMQEETLRTFASLGELAKDAIPLIVEILKGENLSLRSLAAQSLENMGPAAVDPLVELLKERLELRKLVTQILANIGEPAVTRLETILLTGNCEQRKAACEALAKIGPSAIPPLVQALKDESFWIRQSATISLLTIREGIAEPLAELVKSGNPHWRAAAISVLKKIPIEGLPTFIRLANDRRQIVSQFGLKMLRKVGPTHESMLPELLKMSQDPDWKIRRVALWAFARIGKATPEVSATLKKATEDPEMPVALQAQESLENLGETRENSNSSFGQ